MWVKFIPSHVPFILKSNSDNCIKIPWFLTKLHTKLSWLLLWPRAYFGVDIPKSLPHNDRINMHLKQSRKHRAKLPLHANNVQSFAYMVIWLCQFDIYLSRSQDKCGIVICCQCHTVGDFVCQQTLHQYTGLWDYQLFPPERGQILTD